ncbi:hypothetical protein ACQP1G_21165 [Nocardia sp. CA-107356]|uniref:hypothetical protein n=1 Tax=Nocardia sp. CA-107356 TaxID=3239972 RepID=UPI003D924CCA
MSIVTRLRPQGRTPVTDPFNHDFNYSQQQQRAQQRVAEQVDQAFVEALSNDGLLADRAIEEEIRALKRAARLNAAKDAHHHHERRRRQEFAAAEAHADAVAEHRLFTSPAAQLGQLFQGLQTDGRILTRLLWACVAWGAVNVQHSMMVGVPLTEPLWWLAFGVEPILTLPLIVIMRLATRASRRGHVIAKKKILPIEAALVLLTVTLNVGPHICVSDIWTLIFYGIPPLMIASIVGLHAFASSEYATMIGDPSLVEPAPYRKADTTVELVSEAA